MRSCVMSIIKSGAFVQSIVDLENISFGYGGAAVLSDVNLHIHPGQFAALVGPSGAGKTSLLKLVLGLLEPVAGRIEIQNPTAESKANFGNKGAARISYVPQVDAIDWNFPVTVGQVVLMGRTQRSGFWPWPSRTDRQRAHNALDRLGIAHLSQNHIRDLSGGQQQRVFLARALIAEPTLLVLDEPTAGLDMQTAENMLHLLLDLNHDGMTILMTTHDLNLAAAHIPWIICLNRTVIAQGTAEEIFTTQVLNRTYRSDMMVMRQDGLIFVHQRPHGHTLHEAAPNPVPGHPPGVPHVTNGVAHFENGNAAIRMLE